MKSRVQLPESIYQLVRTHREVIALPNGEGSFTQDEQHLIKGKFQNGNLQGDCCLMNQFKGFAFKGCFSGIMTIEGIEYFCNDDEVIIAADDLPGHQITCGNSAERYFVVSRSTVDKNCFWLSSNPTESFPFCSCLAFEPITIVKR